MDNKDLITRFAEDCFRFEALHQEIDSLIADADSEVLAYEYEDLANQAAEIVLKLSANGNNVGENFYRYYVERLEYIIDYFRALLDYEETPLAEDEQDELDDENDTQAAESDEAADDVDRDALFSPDEESGTSLSYRRLRKLSQANQARVWETCEMWREMCEITGRNQENHKMWSAAEILRRGNDCFCAFCEAIGFVNERALLAGEVVVHKTICKAIDAIPGFRDSEKFKELIEQYPTYKEKEQ